MYSEKISCFLSHFFVGILLSSVIFSAKYGTPNKRMEKLFHLVPQLRRLGHLHYAMTQDPKIGITSDSAWFEIILRMDSANVYANWNFGRVHFQDLLYVRFMVITMSLEILKSVFGRVFLLMSIQLGFCFDLSVSSVQKLEIVFVR